MQPIITNNPTSPRRFVSAVIEINISNVSASFLVACMYVCVLFLLDFCCCYLL